MATMTKALRTFLADGHGSFFHWINPGFGYVHFPFRSYGNMISLVVCLLIRKSLKYAPFVSEYVVVGRPRSDFNLVLPRLLTSLSPRIFIKQTPLGCVNTLITF